MGASTIYVVRTRSGKVEQHSHHKVLAIYHAGNFPEGTIVRSEAQDFWYPIEQLVGAEPAKQLLFPCPTCNRMIRARWIDQGLKVGCSECKEESYVPVRSRNAEAVALRSRHDVAKSDLIKGAIAFFAGTGLTAASFLDRGSTGTFVIWWKPAIIGLGLITYSASTLFRLRKISRGRNRLLEGEPK